MHANARVDSVERVVSDRLEDARRAADERHASLQEQIDRRFSATERALGQLTEENRADHNVVMAGLEGARASQEKTTRAMGDLQEKTTEAIGELRVQVAAITASGSARDGAADRVLKVVGAVTALLALVVTFAGLVVAIVSAVTG